MNRQFRKHGTDMTKGKPPASESQRPEDADKPITETGEGNVTPQETEIIDNNIQKRRRALQELSKK